ncbi:HD domain-containing protein [Candidatus Parcubacteria bacterium]|nr:MAG: HD domain-containing protein [Candidatus Parcubacteria bacterium]
MHNIIRIVDNIYGRYEITEPVILKIINSPELQRLKRVSQFGGLPDNYPFPIFYRFEHSLGVMILLDRMKASLEEKIAGLIHDIAHTVFSHVIDFVMGSTENEDYQDHTHEEFFKKSSIAMILTKYGFDIEKIAGQKNFLLLEQPIPKLCADRIDYALRELKSWANPGIVPEILADLTVIDDKIVFKTKETANKFAVNFLRLQTEHWGGAGASSRYYQLAEIIKKALAAKILTLKDLYGDDSLLSKKIEQSPLQADFEKLKSKTLSKVGVTIIKKFRYVDPDIIDNNRVIPLSESESGFLRELERHRRQNALGIEI